MRRTIAVAVALLVPQIAHAEISLDTVVEERSRIAVVSGEFEYGQDLRPITSRIDDFQPDVVSFDSPGGSIYSAMEFGRYLRDRGYATIQIRALECASACSLAFMGGSTRIAEAGSIGVHQTSFSGDGAAADQVSDVQLATADVLAYLREMGIDSELLEVALSYHSSDIRYLSASEMAALGVTTTPNSSARTADIGESRPADAPREDASAVEGSEEPLDAVALASNGDVEIRVAPMQEALLAALVSNGTPMRVHSFEDGWYGVSTTDGRTGYAKASNVKVEGFYDPGAGMKFIQVMSVDTEVAAMDYLRSHPGFDAYLSLNGWYAITIAGTFPESSVSVELDRMKIIGAVPQDAFSTYGNTYLSQLCCR